MAKIQQEYICCKTLKKKILSYFIDIIFILPSKMKMNGYIFIRFSSVCLVTLFHNRRQNNTYNSCMATDIEIKLPFCECVSYCSYTYCYKTEINVCSVKTNPSVFAWRKSEWKSIWTNETVKYEFTFYRKFRW